ncbi:MAG TPA: DNA-3-methyladenine glycosylase I [Anaeromyxobacteraceae bacterium]|nr:DNA-3-methyladenine glycosylase I [Anaeromyxobacteraceae bacterium]
MGDVGRGLAKGADGRVRCAWAASAPDYEAYHDREWGFPVAEDRRLFEKLCLEGFQSGLSWLTILRKRDAFRRAFAGFDAREVARYGRRDVERLLRDPSIVRHRGKIAAAVGNARLVLELEREFGTLAAYVWRFEPAPGSRPRRVTGAALARGYRAPEADAMSKDLRRRGFAFVGPTTAYAFMQAMGLVNDHLEGCHVRPAAEKARRNLERPVAVAGGSGRRR